MRRTLMLIILAASPFTAVAKPCGDLPDAGSTPTADAVTGRWETCKARIAPGCEHGAYQVTFWRERCTVAGAEDFDIIVAFEWISGQPLIPGQPDANNDFRGMAYRATMPNRLVGNDRAIVTLSDGRTTTDLEESETAGPFTLVGVLDRFVGGATGTVPGSARWKFCPSDSRQTFCTGVAGGIEAEPIEMLAHYVLVDDFE